MISTYTIIAGNISVKELERIGPYHRAGGYRFCFTPKFEQP